MMAYQTYDYAFERSSWFGGGEASCTSYEKTRQKKILQIPNYILPLIWSLYASFRPIQRKRFGLPRMFLHQNVTEQSLSCWVHYKLSIEVYESTNKSKIKFGSKL